MQIKLDAQRHGLPPVIGIQSRYLGSLPELMKYGKQRCKKYGIYLLAYEDAQDSTTEASKKNGKFAFVYNIFFIYLIYINLTKQ